ncbi:MAG: nuclear transport factor 2 family protein [Egibacteraceae bacterium]
MSQHDCLLALERTAWEALSSSGDAAADYYAEVLAGKVLMLLPGGLVIDDRAKVIDSMRGAPWTSFELADERVLELTGDSAVVAYRATAQRDGGEYTALFTSTYVREGGSWRLTVHQQTPV